MTELTWVPLNDLGRAMRDDREALTAELQATLDSGYAIHGPGHAHFERELAEYVGVGIALGVASGTDALELAIKAAMPEGRDTVVTAANCGGYTTVAARRGGYRVQYADVDPASLCMTLETLLFALSPRVGVVVVTHLYGLLTDISGLVEHCHSLGIRVVEDCAQAIGARLGGRAAGAWGDLAAVSFYPTKNLGAIGDGGAVLSSNQDLVDRVRTLRTYGWGRKYEIAGQGGVNSRLDELQARFLSWRLRTLDEKNRTRRSIVARYREAASGAGLHVMPADGEQSVAHLAIARTRDREAAMMHFSQLSIKTDIHFPIPDYRQQAYIAEYPGLSLTETEKAVDEVLTLPCFPEMTEREIERVSAAIASFGVQS